jgi:hypothetical protein
MVDNFALALSHGLLAFALWRLMLREDIDADPPAAAPAPGTTAPDTPANAKPARPELRSDA